MSKTRTHTLKRSLSMLVVMAMLLGLLPTVALAADPVTESDWVSTGAAPKLTATWAPEDDVAVLVSGVWDGGGNRYDIYVGGTDTAVLTLGFEVGVTALSGNQSPIVTGVGTDTITLNLNALTSGVETSTLTISDGTNNTPLRIHRAAASRVTAAGLPDSGSVYTVAYDTKYVVNLDSTVLYMTDVDEIRDVFYQANEGYTAVVILNGTNVTDTAAIKAGTGDFDGYNYLSLGDGVDYAGYDHVEISFAAENVEKDAGSAQDITNVLNDLKQAIDDYRVAEDATLVINLTGDVTLPADFEIPAGITLEFGGGREITLSGDLTIGDETTLVLSGTTELVVSPGAQLTIGEGSYLVIEAGATLTVNGAVVRMFTTGFDPATAAMIVNEDITVTGTLNVEDGAVVAVAVGKTITGTTSNINLNTTGRIVHMHGTDITPVDTLGVRTYTGAAAPLVNAPTVTGATINGDELIITFNGELDAIASTFDAADFTVTGVTGDPTYSVAIDAATIVITLDAAALHTDVIEVSYIGNGIKAANGANIAAFSNQAVINNTPEPPAPSAFTITFGSAAKGLLGQTLEVTAADTADSDLAGKVLVVQIDNDGKVMIVAVVLTDADSETVTISYANEAGIKINAWLLRDTDVDMSGLLNAGDYLADSPLYTTGVAT